MKERSRLTVLLVEDHEDSRNAIKNWFEWKGWHVLVAGDKKSGLSLGRKNSVDLLLCDLQLPDGNGWDLMEQLRSEKPVRGILTSGHCSPTDIARSKAVGFLEHLIKPYPVEELDVWLDRVERDVAKGIAVAPPENQAKKKDQKK